jgi:hypothetical protein
LRYQILENDQPIDKFYEAADLRRVEPTPPPVANEVPGS